MNDGCSFALFAWQYGQAFLLCGQELRLRAFCVLQSNRYMLQNAMLKAHFASLLPLCLSYTVTSQQHGEQQQRRQQARRGVVRLLLLLLQKALVTAVTVEVQASVELLLQQQHHSALLLIVIMILMKMTRHRVTRQRLMSVT
jgi:hypothetical protein